MAVARLVTEGIMGSNLLECEILEISTATGEQQCQDCVYPDCTECDPCPTGADFPEFLCFSTAYAGLRNRSNLRCPLQSFHTLHGQADFHSVRSPLLSEPKPPIPVERLESISLKAAQTHVGPS